MPHAAKVQRPAQQPEPLPAVAQAAEPESAARKHAGATSADLRTMDYEEGTACLAPKDDAPQAQPELTRAEELRREDAFDQITAIQASLLNARAEELTWLASASAHKDSPPWWRDAAIVAGAAALTAATAGLGTAVFAGAAAALQRSGLGTTIAQATLGGLRDAAKSFLGKAIEEQAKPALEPGQACAQQFFHTQAIALRATDFDQQRFLIAQARPAIRAAPDSVAQAEAIARGMGTVTPTEARLIQRRASVDAWCAYRGRASVESAGDASAGPTNMRAGLDESELPGVLELKVVAGAPGSRVQVQTARVAGLNEQLRSHLTGRPIGSLRVPMVVSAVVHPGAPSPTADGVPARAHGPGCMHVKLSRDECGNVLLSADSGPAQAWFARRGGAEPASAPPINGRHLDASTRGAAAFIHEDIEPQMLSAEVMK
jgi:hypothetical protein